MIGQRWRSVYYYFPAQLYGIETAKCKKTAIVVQLHQKQTVARVIKLATSEKVNREGGADMETSGEWTTIVIILWFRFHLVGSPCSHIFVQTIQR